MSMLNYLELHVRIKNKTRIVAHNAKPKDDKHRLQKNIPPQFVTNQPRKEECESTFFAG